MQAIKSVKQPYTPTPELLDMLDTFRRMVNDCIRIGLANDAHSMKRLSKLCYHELAIYPLNSRYRLSAISKAAGILAARRKSIKRGFIQNAPYVNKPHLTTSYRFKIVDGALVILAEGTNRITIPLNRYTQKMLSETDIRLRSFTLTLEHLIISYSKEVDLIASSAVCGIDRNVRTIACGNSQSITFYDMHRAIKIAKTTQQIYKSIKRNDRRIRGRIIQKYGRRYTRRVSPMLHRISKSIIDDAKKHNQAIAIEEMTNIRRHYQRYGRYTKSQRYIFNLWSFGKLRLLVSYKATWAGVQIVQLSKRDTMFSSVTCPQCGERLQGGRKGQKVLRCPICMKSFHRDMVAVMNIAYRGWVQLAHSKGDASEAMIKKAAFVEPAILEVDASKPVQFSSRTGQSLVFCKKPET